MADLNPTSPPPRVLLKRGMLAVRRGQMDAARQHLDALLAADPTHEEALLWRARAAADPDEQAALLRRAIEVNPENQWAQTQLDRLATPDDAPAPTGPADAPRVLTVQALQCPNCAGQVEVHGGAKIKTVVCQHCSSLIDLTPSQAAILARSTPDVRPEKPITPGMRATFDEEYLCVGWLRYEGSDDEETWTWDEWLLVAPSGQMRWLTYDDEAGFALLRETALTQPITPRSRTVHTADGPARVFERDDARFVALRGELTWRARVGDRIRYLDARRGRTIVSVEISGDEIEVFEGRRLSPREVWTAFGEADRVAAFDRKVERREAARFYGVVCLLLALGHLGGLLFAHSSGTEVLQELVRLEPGGPMTVGTFEAPVAGQTYRLDVESQMLSHRDPSFTERASWAWIQALVHTSDGAGDGRLSGDRAVVLSDSPWRERGRDSDGPWQESDPDAYDVFEVPAAGTYTVEVVMPEHALTPAQLPLPLTVTVRRGVWLARWFLAGIGLFAVLTWSLFAYAYSKPH